MARDIPIYKGPASKPVKKAKPLKSSGGGGGGSSRGGGGGGGGSSSADAKKLKKQQNEQARDQASGTGVLAGRFEAGSY